MKKRVAKKKENSKAKSPQPQPPTADDKEHPFDYGGMPARDLKKNLGCG